MTAVHSVSASGSGLRPLAGDASVCKQGSISVPSIRYTIKRGKMQNRDLISSLGQLWPSPGNTLNKHHCALCAASQPWQGR